MRGRLPALIAHRGASGYAPENTMAAFELALEMGAGSAEFDVQQTKDGRLVVIHDTDLKRVAGVRRGVGAMTWPELSRLDIGAWFSARFAGERVPLLEEVLDLFRGKAELQLELKQPVRPYRGMVRRVAELLASRPLFEFRSLAPAARLGYLVGLTRRSVALAEARELRCESVNLSARQADETWARALHSAGLKMLVYTVNEPKEYERLGELGVDAVFTNFPEVGRLYRDRGPRSAAA
ncbi:MAG: glycerophosphodiester phosphodiesterase family protein [Elusimicrobia bacterium]|nr:glycerophosphodiester phosphodiesterase family protein [Elusimicrobiota bacterium]